MFSSDKNSLQLIDAAKIGKNYKTSKDFIKKIFFSNNSCIFQGYYLPLRA